MDVSGNGFAIELNKFSEFSIVPCASEEDVDFAFSEDEINGIDISTGKNPQEVLSMILKFFSNISSCEVGL